MNLAEINSKIDFASKSLTELKEFLVHIGEKPFRAEQIFSAIHRNLATSFADVTTISKGLREKLDESVDWKNPHIKEVKESSDGTRKYRLLTHDGHLIESVFIPNASSAGRNTICISSQVGCAMGCTFCATAKMQLKRNLVASEIAGQIYAVVRDLRAIGWQNPVVDFQQAETSPRLIHNIVYMGMGEPLHNYEHVKRSIELLTSEEGQLYSPRRITVSTSGLVKNIERLGQETDVHLAVSLNASNDEVRNVVMPVNLKWNIEKLLDACRTFPLASRERITFEYVMLAGVNDANEDAFAVCKLLKGLQCKVNLIPFNEHPLSNFKRPSKDRVKTFQEILAQKNISVFVRATRGDDIDAACGMLGGKNLEEVRLNALT